ncbi:glycoside hydrolase superfamily, partial [Lactarius pseudohatsudake]
MQPSAFLVLLGAGRILAASSPSSQSSYFPSSAGPSLSFPTPSGLSSSLSPSLPPYSSVPTSPASSSSSGSGTSSSSLSSLHSLSTTTSGSGVLTQPLPSGTPISSYPFVPFPSPSSEPPSPGVYPLASPNTPPPVDTPALVPDFGPAWTSAYEKAKAKVATFTLDQKVNITTGVGWQDGRCVGNIPSVGDFPGLCLNDSPLGVRFADFATVFPAAINAATTWKRSLIRARGLAMGQEHVGKGVNIALGPMMNLGRIAQGGRNWEGFGADPFLASVGAYETIIGMQSAGVQACAKHYINNEQEHDRTKSSSNVDDRTQHEIYAAPFLRSVMAGVASGFVMSDWGATHSNPQRDHRAGLTMPGDITLNSGTSYFVQTLLCMYKMAHSEAASWDDMAIRILAGWYLLSQELRPSYPHTNFNAFHPLDQATNEHIDVQDDHGQEVGGALPLKKPRTLVLIGSDAGPAHGGGPNAFSSQTGIDGILAMGWGSGTAKFTYLISVPIRSTTGSRTQGSHFLLWVFNDFNLADAGSAAVQQDAASSSCSPTLARAYITVDGNAGDRHVTTFPPYPLETQRAIHRKNLTAWHNGDALRSSGAGLGGTETGNALVDVLYGAVNPSGRLPYTIAKSPSDYSAQLAKGGTGNE